LDPRFNCPTVLLAIAPNILANVVVAPF